MRYVAYTLLLFVATVLLAAPVMSADERPVRVVGNQRYAILEAGELYIYSTEVLVRKGAIEKAYFFSVGPNGEILPLTILNLKKAFPGNHVFHDNLDMAFNNDLQLTKFDEFHKMFKVTRLLQASQR